MNKNIVIFLLAIAINCQKTKLKSPLMSSITRQIEMKIQIGEEILREPLQIALYGKDAPSTTRRFYSLCTQSAVKSDGKLTGYVGSKFHKIIPKSMIQGGDFIKQDGSGIDYSEEVPDFEEDELRIKHAHGVVGMINPNNGKIGNQFYITTSETPWLDRKNVVFGLIWGGMDIVNEIEKMGTASGKPIKEVKILECYDPSKRREAKEN